MIWNFITMLINTVQTHHRDYFHYLLICLYCFEYRDKKNKKGNTGRSNYTRGTWFSVPTERNSESERQKVLMTQVSCVWKWIAVLFNCVLLCETLGGNKVSMLTHTLTNPWGRLKWPYAITRLTIHFMRGLTSNLVICKFSKSMIIHDTECPYCDQVSLNNTYPNQPFFVSAIFALTKQLLKKGSRQWMARCLGMYVSYILMFIIRFLV